MAFSAGVYTLPTPALVPGQTVSSSENNTVRNDMAASFNLTWLRNGTAAATANIPMGSYKLTGLGAATTSGDALSYGNAAVVTTLTSTSLTATRVPYAGTGGLLQDASTFTFDGTTLTAGGFTTSGAISAGTITASGAITVSGGTANGVAYLNGSKVLTTGSALTFDGTNLGVGVTPSVSLDVGGPIRSRDTVNAPRIYFTDAAYQTDIRSTNNSLLFNLNGGTEQMRLTSTGLGIGTSSPGRPLDVLRGTAGFVSRMGYSAGQSIYQFADANAAYISTGTNLYNAFGINETGSYLNFYTANAECMRLDSSGNLGLGVAPSAWASIYRSIDLGGGISLFGEYGSVSGELAANAYINSSVAWTYKGNGYASHYRQYNGQHQWHTAPSGTAGNAISFTQAMTLDASGNLGIGTSSPNYNLHVNSSTAASYLQITNTGTGTAVTDGLLIGNDASGANIIQREVAPLIIYTSNTERMRIHSSGGVSIGNTTDLGATNLYVTGSLATGGDVFETQPTPTAKTATATLTIAELLTNIITVTSTTAVTLTLPTGTLTDAGILGGLLPVNGSFDWSVINLGTSSGAVTIAGGTGHTFVGLATVPISTSQGSSAWFRTRKTAANTFVTYRVG